MRRQEPNSKPIISESNFRLSNRRFLTRQGPFSLLRSVIRVRVRVRFQQNTNRTRTRTRKWSEAMTESFPGEVNKALFGLFHIVGQLSRVSVAASRLTFHSSGPQADACGYMLLPLRGLPFIRLDHRLMPVAICFCRFAAYLSFVWTTGVSLWSR